MSISLTGRRYARRVSVERIRRAHGSSSAADEGLRTKLRRRLGESLADGEGAGSSHNGSSDNGPNRSYRLSSAVTTAAIAGRSVMCSSRRASSARFISSIER